MYLSKLQTKCMALITAFVMILSCLAFVPSEAKAADSTTPTVSVLGASLRLDAASGHQSMRIGVLIENASKAGACGMTMNIGGKTVRIATDGDGTDVIKGDKIYDYNKDTDSILYTAVITDIPSEHFSTDIQITGTLTTLEKEEKSSAPETKNVIGIVEKMKSTYPSIRLLEDGTLVNEMVASLDTSTLDSLKEHGNQNNFYSWNENSNTATAELDAAESAIKFTTAANGKGLTYQISNRKDTYVYEIKVKADSDTTLKLCGYFGETPIDNQTFQGTGDWQTITVKTDMNDYEARVLTTTTAGAVYYVKSCKIYKPLTSDDYSGSLSLPGKPLDLSGTVMLGGGSPSYDSNDGSVSAAKCDGLVIPLDKDYEAGDELRITVFGEASQGMRAWLETGTGDSGRASEIHDPMKFGETFTITATANGAKYLEIKKPNYSSPVFENIKITRVELTDLTDRPVLDTEGWVTTWGTAEERCDVNKDTAMPKMNLDGTTVRQIIRVTTKGQKIRFRLSNQYGKSDVTIKSMHIAKQVTPRESTIDTSTDTIVTVKNSEEFVIPQGKVIVTDAIEFDVNALENIAISTFFGSTPTENITGHRGARATTYQMSGNNVSTDTFTDYQTTTSWFFLADASLWTPEGGRAVVCFGDSITDGYGTDATYLGKQPDSYTRWADYFAKRLQANEKTKNVAVINEGIGSNSILGAYPTDAGKDRFSRDLLQHDNVAYCIILFGVNDLNKLQDATLFDKLLPEYQKMVKLCHDNNIKVYGAPILPFGTSDYYSEGSEQVRQLINNWMRSTDSQMDGIIDFEHAVADPDNPQNCLEEYTHEDGLHPYDGYEVMANAIDLTLFE